MPDAVVKATSSTASKPTSAGATRCKDGMYIMSRCFAFTNALNAKYTVRDEIMKTLKFLNLQGSVQWAYRINRRHVA